MKDQKDMTARELGKAIRTELDNLSVRFPADAAELERVLNLGVPLADLLTRGMVRSVTAEGRDHMTSTYADIVAAAAVLADYPELSGNFPKLWDAIFDRVYARQDTAALMLDCNGQPAGE